MAATSDTFTFELKGEDKGVGALVGKLEALKSVVKADVAELGALSKASRDLKLAGGADTELAKTLASKIEAQKAKVRTGLEGVARGGTFAPLAPPGRAGPPMPRQPELPERAVQPPGGIEALRTALRRLVPESTIVGGAIGKLEKAFSLFGSKGAAAGIGVAGAAGIATVAIAALGAAVVAAGAAFAVFGFAATNAARAERLSLEGMTAGIRMAQQWTWGMSMARDSSESLQRTIDTVSATVAIGREKVVSYATGMYEAGLRGDRLKKALEAVSLATSAGGEKYGAMIRSMATGAAYFGGSVDRVLARVKKDFGPIVEKQMLDIGVQASKAKDNISRLFRDLPIEPLLKGLQAVLSVFDQTTVTGQGLKAVVEGFLSPLAKLGKSGGNVLKIFFQECIIAALNLQIAFVRLNLWIQRTFSVKWDWLDLGAVAAVAAKVAVYGLAGSVGVLALALAALAAPIVTTVAALYGLYKAVKWVVDNIGDKLSVVAKAVNIGKQFSEGLVRGMAAGAPAAATAAAATADGMATAAAEAAGVHSPSTVGMWIGSNFGLGLARGARAERRTVATSGTDLSVSLATGAGARLGIPPRPPEPGLYSRAEFPPVQQSRAPMVVPALAPAGRLPPATAAGRPAPNAQAGASVQIGELHLHGAGQTSGEFVRSIRDELASEFERLALQIGAPYGQV